MKLYSIHPVESDFFYLAECICVSSTLLCESIVPPFLLLTSFQLCGYTTVYPYTSWLTSGYFQFEVLWKKSLQPFTYWFLWKRMFLFLRFMSRVFAGLHGKCMFNFGIPRWLSGKESSCRYRRCSFDPWVGKNPLEEEMPTHSSILAQEIPWTMEPGGLESIGLQRGGHDWATEHKVKLLNK